MKKKILFIVSAMSLMILGGVFNFASASNTSSFTQEFTPLPQGSYQIARSVFLPDYKEPLFAGYELDKDYNQTSDCDNVDSLYTTQNCSYPRAVVSSSQCVNKSGYYTECVCMPQFKYSACTSPYVLSGDSCDGNYEKCACPQTVELEYSNDKCTQYCDGKCIAKSCTPLEDQTGCANGVVNCDDGCGGTTRKCCAGCTDKVTTKPANSSYTYSSCTDGSGSHQIQTGWECDSGYYESGGACEKNCVTNNCSGYTLGSCPANTVCSSCTITASDCSTDGTKYKIDGCDSGYELSGGSCVEIKTCTENTCSGYTLSSCPSNGTCSECTVTNTDCSTSGKPKYKLTGCNSGYEISGNSCVVSGPKVGDILYSDLTTGRADDYPVAGKTAIGVVIAPDRTLAVALESKGLAWSTEYIDVEGLPNLENGAELNDFNGKENTQIIVADGDANGYDTPAADYAYFYSTKGTTAGDWYLGAKGEVELTQKDNYTINQTLKKVSNIQITQGHYWTSSENDNYYAWSDTNEGKDNSYNVYPIINYSDVGNCTPNPCDGFTLTSEPSNASYQSCTIKNADCSTGETKYKITSCNTGYHLSGDKCAPDCEVKTCSEFTLSSCPTHGQCDQCTPEYSDCSTGSPKYKLTGCDDGYEMEGNTCVEACVNTCKDTFTGTLPANASYITEACSACGQTTQIKTGWKCNSGYSKNSTGTACISQCEKELEGALVVTNSSQLSQAESNNSSDIVVIDGNISVGSFSAKKMAYVSIEAYAPSCNRTASISFTNLTFAGNSTFAIPVSAQKVSVGNNISATFQSDFSATEVVLSGTSAIDLGVNGSIGKLTLSGNSYAMQLYSGGYLTGLPWSPPNRTSRGSISINNFSTSGANFGIIQLEDVKITMPASLLNAFRNSDSVILYGTDLSYSGSLNKIIDFTAEEGEYTDESCVNNICTSFSTIRCSRNGCY